MRELQDYFCTYEQTEELIKLGFINYKSLMCWNKEHGVLKLGNPNVFTISRAPLRSQALDFFRELEYEFKIEKYGYGYLYEIKLGENNFIVQQDFTKYDESESQLISRLIELEKEARNGN